jgi:hypothetical protein
MLPGKGSKNTMAYSRSWWAHVTGSAGMTDKLDGYPEANIIDLYTLGGREVHREEREKRAGTTNPKTPGRPRKSLVVEDSEDESGSDGEAGKNDRLGKGKVLGEEKDAFADDDTLVET